MSIPDPTQIEALFAKTMVEYVDAVDALTALYDCGKQPDDQALYDYVYAVSRRREKLSTCVKSALYYHGTDLGLVIPLVNFQGGIC